VNVRDVNLAKGGAAMSRTLLVLMIGALAISTSRPAIAGEMPSEWWRAKLTREFSSVERVRLRGDHARWVLWTAVVDSVGVTGYEGHAAPRLADAVSDALPQPTRVPWERIDFVERPVNATGRGVLIGAAAGALLAVVLASASDADRGDTGALWDWRAPAWMVGGALAGGWVGSARDRWSIVYPPEGTRGAAWEAHMKETKP
jgi:hypothetical protein